MYETTFCVLVSSQFSVGPCPVNRRSNQKIFLFRQILGVHVDRLSRSSSWRARSFSGVGSNVEEAPYSRISTYNLESLRVF